jgi:hypothetical protein
MLGIPDQNGSMPKEARYIYFGFIAVMSGILLLYRYTDTGLTILVMLLIITISILFFIVYWVGRKSRWDWSRWD